MGRRSQRHTVFKRRRAHSEQTTYNNIHVHQPVRLAGILIFTLICRGNRGAQGRLHAARLAPTHQRLEPNSLSFPIVKLGLLMISIRKAIVKTPSLLSFPSLLHPMVFKDDGLNGGEGRFHSVGRRDHAGDGVFGQGIVLEERASLCSDRWHCVLSDRLFWPSRPRVVRA